MAERAKAAGLSLQSLKWASPRLDRELPVARGRAFLALDLQGRIRRAAALDVAGVGGHGGCRDRRANVRAETATRVRGGAGAECGLVSGGQHDGCLRIGFAAEQCPVYRCRKKITQSDFFSSRPNRRNFARSLRCRSTSRDNLLWRSGANLGRHHGELARRRKLADSIRIISVSQDLKSYGRQNRSADAPDSSRTIATLCFALVTATYKLDAEVASR